MGHLTVCRTAILGAFVISATPWAAAVDPVEAEWLYLTDNGSWVARSAALRKTTTQLPLPIDRLTSDTFWWSATNPDVTLNWQSPDNASWVQESDLVQVSDWPGSWTIISNTGDVLILSQAGVRRSLPKTSWDRLSWIVGQSQGESLSLQVSQAEAVIGELAYAWFDTRVSAEVRYSLDPRAETPVLLQQLVVHNEANYELQAPGYSYAQSSEQPTMMLARSTGVSESLSSDVARPQAGDSSGQATLTSAQAIAMPPNSHAWLPVESVELNRIEHQYHFNWSTRQQGSMPGQWSMDISSDENLPDIAGPVQVAVWDQQVALLETRYQPEQANQTTLSMGSSDMVTLGTETLGGQQWQLTVTNRNSHEVEAMLELSHWDNNRNEQAAISVPVPANASLRLAVRLGNNQLTVRPL